jgi:hypothetical protein
MFGWSYPPGCSGTPYDDAPDGLRAELRQLGAENARLIERRDSLARSCASYAVENERLRSELAIRAEWFEQMGHPGMAEATRAAVEQTAQECPWCKTVHTGACARLISGGQSD